MIIKKTKLDPPKPAHMGLYRATLSCKIGMDAIDDNKFVLGASSLEYAVYNLLGVVEDIAKYLLEKEAKSPC